LKTPNLRWTWALALVFFLAHVFFLPSTLEDIDSLNFALGLHDFNPTKHQPHPPGYPVFMALGKIARAVVPSDAKALALLGAIFGALAIFPLMRLFEALELLEGGASIVDRPSSIVDRPSSIVDRRSSSVDRPASIVDRRWSIAGLATVLTIASPLYWFNALRPLSDVPGLAFTLAAQAALVTAFVRQRMNPDRTPDALAASGQMIVLGAFLSAIAIGMRSQALWLTVPLLSLVLLQRVGRGAAGAILGSAMTFSIGVLLWLVPLVFASGGLRAYRAALSAQGGEDFSGVDMLYRNPTARRVAFGLLETFIYPWAASPLGWVVFALAGVGMMALLWRAARTALLVVMLGVPYLVFHLLFQETVTTRYALPLIPLIAFLAVYGVRTLVAPISRRPTAASLAVVVIVIWSLALTLPAARVYAREGSPAFAAIRELHEVLRQTPDAAIGMHQGLARSVQTQNFGTAQVLKAPPMREWLELATYWRNGHTAPVWFLADPARTDIELIDPLSRNVRAHYVWSFPRERFMSGVRPDIVDLIKIDSPPGWFAEEGWHLTSETLNMSERLRLRQGTAYVRSRPGAALLVIGGESSGAVGDVSVSIDDRVVDRWKVAAGASFFRRIPLAPGALQSASTYRKLVASYGGADATLAPIRLTQFTVEPPDAVFFVPHAGWNEIEYSKELQRRWRWTTAKATTFINSGGRDVTLTIDGESPLKYFDAAPTVTVRAGNQVLATTSPASDFHLNVKIPWAVLQAADGDVTLETNRSFSPHERSGSADKRTLGLRIFTFDVR
jgi:hypothetical protein